MVWKNVYKLKKKKIPTYFPRIIIYNYSLKKDFLMVWKNVYKLKKVKIPMYIPRIIITVFVGVFDDCNALSINTSR